MIFCGIYSYHSTQMDVELKSSTTSSNSSSSAPTSSTGSKRGGTIARDGRGGGRNKRTKKTDAITVDEMEQEEWKALGDESEISSSNGESRSREKIYAPPDPNDIIQKRNSKFNIIAPGYPGANIDEYDDELPDGAYCLAVETSKVKTLKMQKTIKIPAYSRVTLPLKINVNDIEEWGDKILIEGCRHIDQAGVMIGNSMCKIDVDPDENNLIMIYVTVANITRIPKMLKKGTVIGKVQPIEEVIDKEITESNEINLIQKATQEVGPQQQVIKKATQEVGPRQQAINLLTTVKSSILSRINLDDTELSLEQKVQLGTLIEKYQDCFANDNKAPSSTVKVYHDIDTGDADPIKSAPARVSPIEQKEIDKQVKEMLENKIIEPSQSPWASRVVMVKKKDGTLRFCIDYRALNAVTQKDSYPLPLITEALDAMQNCKIFSTIDLASEYWQIPLTKRAKRRSAFVTRSGFYQFLRMPFGSTNAPATFQRMMDLVLSGMNWIYCLVYLDDVMIFSINWETHLIHLEELFKRLRANKLVIKAEKCRFACKELLFLGHIISSKGIAVDPSKIEVIKNYPIPTNVREVRSLLGLMSYYRKFIPTFAHIAEPLHKLLKKNKVFVWDKECEKAFDKLRDLLINAPILRRPDYTRPFYIVCDASDFGLGAVLEQEDIETGNRYAVAYWSRSLQPRERKYTVTQREALAAVEAIRQFKHHVYGQQFEIETDHNSLTYLKTKKDLTGRLGRWAEHLQQFLFTIKYRKGKKNAVADALSRLPIPLSMNEELVPVEFNDHIYVITQSKGKLMTEEEEPIEIQTAIGRKGKKVPIHITEQEEQSIKTTTTHMIEYKPHEEKKQEVKINNECNDKDELTDEWVLKDQTLIDLTKPESTEVIKRKQMEYRPYAEMINYLTAGIVEENRLITEIVPLSGYFLLSNEGVLYRIRTDNQRKPKETVLVLAVPPSITQDILAQVHDSKTGGHLGLNKTYLKLRERY